MRCYHCVETKNPEHRVKLYFDISFTNKEVINLHQIIISSRSLR